MKRSGGNIISRQLLRIPAGVLTFIVFAAILWLTLAPDPLPEEELPKIPGIDKLAHACMFGGFYFVMALDSVTWRFTRSGKKEHVKPAGVDVCIPVKSVILFAVVAGLLGGVIELAQGAMGMGRGCDPWDFLADLAGIAASVWLTPAVLILLHGVSGNTRK